MAGRHSDGFFSISDTSVNHNTATSDGGGIYSTGGTLNLTTSASVNSNTADTDGGEIHSTVALGPRRRRGTQHPRQSSSTSALGRREPAAPGGPLFWAFFLSPR